MCPTTTVWFCRAADSLLGLMTPSSSFEGIYPLCREVAAEVWCLGRCPTSIPSFLMVLKLAKQPGTCPSLRPLLVGVPRVLMSTKEQMSVNCMRRP